MWSKVPPLKHSLFWDCITSFTSLPSNSVTVLLINPVIVFPGSFLLLTDLSPSFLLYPLFTSFLCKNRKSVILNYLLTCILHFLYVIVNIHLFNPFTTKVLFCIPHILSKIFPSSHPPRSCTVFLVRISSPPCVSSSLHTRTSPTHPSPRTHLIVGSYGERWFDNEPTVKDHNPVAKRNRKKEKEGGPQIGWTESDSKCVPVRV